MPEVLLSELIIERRERAHAEKLPVWSVSNQFGFGSPRDLFKKDIASEDTSNYKKIYTGDIAYNPSRINIGSVALNESENMGIVSPMYVVFSVKEKEKLDPLYLFHFLKSPKGKLVIKHNVQGGVRFQLKFSQLCEIKIPLPDIKTQRHLISLFQRAEGLNHIRAEADKKIKELISSLFIEMFGDPFGNPNDWETAILSDIGEWRSGGTPARDNPDFFGGTIDWYTTGELNDGYLFDSAERITDKAIKHSPAKLFKKDSLVIGMYDTAALKLGILTKDASTNQACAVAKINDRAINRFLLEQLIILRPRLLLLRRGIRQQNLNLDMVKNFKVILPPIQMQMEYVNKIKAIEEFRAKQQNSVEKLLEFHSSLFLSAYEGSNESLQNEHEKESGGLTPSPIKIFPIQQAVGVILQQGFERGEMVLGKVLYLGQEIYKVGLGVPFIAYKFGPWDIAVKNAVNGGASKKNQFFKRKKVGKGAVLALGPNADKLFDPYADAAVVKDMNAAMNKLLPLIKFWKSPDIECLATVCKVVQDNKTLDEGVVVQKVSEWKPNKFTADRVQYMLQFILQQGWDKKLI